MTNYKIGIFIYMTFGIVMSIYIKEAYPSMGTKSFKQIEIPLVKQYKNEDSSVNLLQKDNQKLNLFNLQNVQYLGIMEFGNPPQKMKM